MAREKGDELHVSEPKTTAVGIPGVRHAMKYALSEMGLVRSASTLFKMNQVRGFGLPRLRLARPHFRRTKPFGVLRERCQGGGLGGHAIASRS